MKFSLQGGAVAFRPGLPISHFAARIDHVPAWLPPVQTPRTALRAAASNNSLKGASASCGRSADQLPLYSIFDSWLWARHTPFQPVENFFAVHLPLKLVAPPASCNVHVPATALADDCGSTYQVPPYVWPWLDWALHDDVERSSCEKPLLTDSLRTASEARSQPIKPRRVRTMYQVSFPTASASNVSGSSFCNVVS